jgi:hypothetical protein
MEQPTPYDIDRTTEAGELTFRLTSTDGFSIGMQFPPGPEADALATLTRGLVLDAFQRRNGVFRFPETVYANHHAEILAQCTLARINALEQTLSDCRNAMIDAPTDAVPDEDRWLDLIDQAGELLGVAP